MTIVRRDESTINPYTNQPPATHLGAGKLPRDGKPKDWKTRLGEDGKPARLTWCNQPRPWVITDEIGKVTCKNCILAMPEWARPG